jgi:DNA polymerase I-like protein with 3'-5' exonuclease and polymerase domains
MRIGTFDLETNGFYEEATVIWCGAVLDHQSGDTEAFGPDDIDSLTTHLDTYDVLIGHNCIDFDFPVLEKIKGYKYGGKVVDTLLMSRMQRPTRAIPNGYLGRAPHSVEAWGHRLGDAKQAHDEWDRYSDDMLSRCVQDVQIQHKIYNALRNEGEGEGWAPAHKLNAQIFTHLRQQEITGWTVDQPHLQRSIDTLTRWMDKVEKALRPHLPYQIEALEAKGGHVKKPFLKNGSKSKAVHTYAAKIENPAFADMVCGPFSRVLIRPLDLDSNKELKEFLLSQGWKPEKWNKDAQGNRTSASLHKDDPFAGIQGAMGRLAVKRVQCRQRRGVLEGWRASVRDDGRIGPRVAGIASTGRLRHSGIVNVPSVEKKSFFAKQMRQVFIAREGWVMVGCDSKGNQMRQLAARMGDEEFTYAVLNGTKEEGTDLHSLNQKRSGAPSRGAAKNFFYGCILFGAGDAKTATMLGVSKDEAAQIKARYLEELPALTNVIEKLAAGWKETATRYFNSRWNTMEYRGGYIRGLDGRPIQVEFEKDLLVYALQSDEAIHMGLAYCLVHDIAKSAGENFVLGKDWNMLFWMHDEFQMECRPEIADWLAGIASQAIREAGQRLGIECPHDGDAASGRSWYDTH